MVAHAEMTIRSLSNHDGERKENVIISHIKVGKQAGLHALNVRFLHCSTFRGRSVPINDLKLPVLKLYGARDLTRYFVFVFFTKR